MLDERNLRSHDASRFNADRVVDWHRGRYLLNKVDAELDVCALKRLVGGGERCVDFRLNVLCLIDESHQLAQKNVSLLVHQHIALTGECERILCENQISLCGKGV